MLPIIWHLINQCISLEYIYRKPGNIPVEGKSKHLINKINIKSKK